MNKIIHFLFFTLLYLKGASLPAQDTIDISTINGHVNIYDGHYTIGGTSTDYSGAYLFTGGTTNEYYLKIHPGNYTDTSFSFKNITMNSGSGNGGFLLMQTKIKLNFIGNNHVESKRGLFQNTDTLTISGDSLTVNANNNYPAIGPASSPGSLITINNKYIYARTGSTSYPAIGGSGLKSDSITINGTTVTAISGGNYNIQANYICINSGSVKGILSRNAVNGTGDTVYCVTVPHNGQLSIDMNDGTKDCALTFYAHHPDDGNFYIYLPNGTYTFNNGDGAVYTAIVDGADAIASVPSIAGDGIIDVSSGKTVSVYDTTYYIGVQPYTYKGHKFTFTGTATSGGVTVYSKLADTLTFQNLDIQMDNGCAFSLQTGTNIELLLQGNNTLKSTGGYAGLEKDSTSGTLTICGPDTLNASGRIGIGNCWLTYSPGCGNIIFKSGVVNTKGTAVGIGGGPNAKGGTIIIEGGEISASCSGTPYVGDAGIGSIKKLIINGGKININTGDEAAFYGCNVTINGGIVTVVGGGAPTLPTNIAISGGTVFIKNTGTPEYFVSSNNTGFAFKSGTFTGGSINMVGSDGETVSIVGKYYNSDYTTIVQNDHPVDADSNLLYRSLYIVPEISEPTLVDSIIINDTRHWGSKDVYTDSTGALYLWVAEADTSLVKIYINRKAYIYSGKVIAYDNYYAADEEQGIVEYGNCLWQVPLNITEPKNGTLEVNSAGTTLTSGDYFCYKTALPLSVTAIPETGCETDSITVYGSKTTGDTTVTVTDTISITAYFSKETGISYITTDNIWVYSKDKTLYVHSSENAEISVYSISGTLVTTQQATSSTTAIPVQQSGIYILKITAGTEKTNTLKCIVQ